MRLDRAIGCYQMDNFSGIDDASLGARNLIFNGYKFLKVEYFITHANFFKC